MSLNRHFAAVIFDVDQTLVDSSAALYSAWSQWAEAEEVSAEQLADWHGHPTAAIVEALVPADRVQRAGERIDALEVETAVSCVALPGAVDAVAATSAAGRCALATSGTRAVATARVTAAGITPPDVFVTVDDVTRGKPAPDLFLCAAERLGADPAQCLVVEDAPAGIEAARAAGMSVLALATSTPATALHADAVVENLAAVRFEADDEGIRVVILDKDSGARSRGGS